MGDLLDGDLRVGVFSERQEVSVGRKRASTSQNAYDFMLVACSLFGCRSCQLPDELCLALAVGGAVRFEDVVKPDLRLVENVRMVP